MPHATIDLDSIYRDQVSTARRGVALLDSRMVVIQDEWVTAKNKVTVEWQMLTRAEVIPGDDRLTLRQGEKTLVLLVHASSPIRIEVLDVSKPVRPHDVPNPGVRKIRITLATEAGERGWLRCLAFPGSHVAPETIPTIPLERWSS